MGGQIFLPRVLPMNKFSFITIVNRQGVEANQTLSGSPDQKYTCS
ncbi:MAG: hypothetical protein P4L74_01425 [Candidatus Doudnabacteria bacterium]|nr:hypothetical protein [Candidatus Doudnabacteria bacterium]